MLTEMNTVSEFLDLLDVLGNNIETNISINQMTSGLQYLLGLVPTFNGQNPLDFIYIKSMVLSAEYGYMSNPYYSFKLSYAFPYKGAIEDARKQMLINLEKQLPTFNLNFSFNGFEEYKGAQWVKPYYDDSLLNDSTENNETSTNTSYETPVQGQVNSTTNDHTTSTLPTVNSENTDLNYRRY